ncbi:MAG: (2Fe-2S)-binding protein [Polyangiaceae bacterium]
MIVCLCKGVSDRDIARAIDEGASSLADIAACTGAGTGCGRCKLGIQRSLAMAEGKIDRPRIILPIVAAALASGGN